MFVRMLVASVARFGEMSALTVADIDRDACTARISKAWKPDGCGGRILGLPKTRKSLRTFNLSCELVRDLDLDRPADQLLFGNPHGGPIRYEAFRLRWTASIRKLVQQDENGRVVTDRLKGKRHRPHDLRHTCASWMIAVGVPLACSRQYPPGWQFS
ncbi:tyrosine-type recombinase/integrase [Nocardia wallacei]|uniref:tyrosine-type recombinase/integrase n=1 Tax=Nocardia wallacei TaxID=480035 RepID=UPI00313CBCE8